MASRGRSSDFKGNSDSVEIYEEKVPQFTWAVHTLLGVHEPSR